jgi:hypothetical protein
MMHFAWCVRSGVVGNDDRSRIDVELRFALGRDRSDIATTDERDVTYQLAGLKLSAIQKFEFSRSPNVAITLVFRNHRNHRKRISSLTGAARR